MIHGNVFGLKHVVGEYFQEQVVSYIGIKIDDKTHT